MVGEIYDDEPVEVAEKKEDSGEETQKKESKKSLCDELLEVMEESECLNDYVDHVCAVASGPPGGRGNLVSAMIQACVQSILRAEIKTVTSEVARYRTLLARKIQESPREELDFEATFKIEKLMESFGDGWRLLKQGEEEDVVFEAFMTKMNIRLPRSPEEEEPEKPSDNDSASLVSIMIQCCIHSILRNEIKALALEMVEYRNVLSEKMLSTPNEELDLQGTFSLCKLDEGFGAGWRSFKHGCGEDAAFEAFATKMGVRFKDTTQSNTE